MAAKFHFDKIKPVKFSDYDKKAIIEYMFDFVNENEKYREIRNDEERKWVLSVEIISNYLRLKFHRLPFFKMFELDFENFINNEVYDTLCKFSFDDLCAIFCDLDYITKILIKKS